MAIKANIVIDQGTDFEAIIDVQDTNEQPFVLSGYTIASQMRKNYASASAITFTAVHNGSRGQIVLSLDKSQTVDIEPGRYLYDVEMTSAGGITTRVVEGIVTVNPGITRV
jgi:hypothetical protein